MLNAGWLAVRHQAHRPPFAGSGRCFRTARSVSCTPLDFSTGAPHENPLAFRLCENPHRDLPSHPARTLLQSRYGRIWNIRVCGNIDRVRPWCFLRFATGSNRRAVFQYALPSLHRLEWPVSLLITPCILSASDTIHKPLGNAITLKLAGEKSGGACRTEQWHAINEFNRVQKNI